MNPKLETGFALDNPSRRMQTMLKHERLERRAKNH